MPGIFQLSVDNIIREAKEVSSLGIPAVILFGIPEHKDETGSEAYADSGIVQQAVRGIKDKIADLIGITDVGLCEDASHGHGGVVKDGKVLNDPTLELLAKESVSHVKAGADIVAPSDMMDGRVSAIRQALDKEGFENIPVMSYNVSGEYSLVKAAGRLGWIDESRVMMETLTSIKRAGADIILTYFAKDAALVLREDR